MITVRLVGGIRIAQVCGIIAGMLSWNQDVEMSDMMGCWEGTMYPGGGPYQFGLEGMRKSWAGIWNNGFEESRCEIQSSEDCGFINTIGAHLD